MKRCFVFLFCFIFFLHLPLQANWSDNEDFRTAIEKQFTQGVDQIKLMPKSKGAFAEGVYEITLKDKTQSVAKVFKDYGFFIKELESYTQHKNFLAKNYEETSERPHFVAFQGSLFFEGKGVLLFEKAKGRPLKDYFKRMLTFSDVQREEALETLFPFVGRQIAGFHLAFGDRNIVHGDLHMDNIWVQYNSRGHKVIFIDYATLGLRSSRPTHDRERFDLIFKDQYLPNQEEKLQEQWLEEQGEWLFMSNNLIVEQEIYIHERLNILRGAHAAMKQGYNDAFEAAGNDLRW